jgi:hypothetical protein
MKKEKMMKKKISWIGCAGLAGLFLAMTISMGGCAASGVLTKSSDPNSMMHFSEVKKWDETKSLNNQVFYVNQGETLPLSISIDSDFMAVKQDHIDIVAKEKIFFMVKMPNNLSMEELKRLNAIDAQSLSEMDADQRRAFFKNYMIFVSKDAVHWAPLNNGKALKKVLDFSSGRVSFGMMASTTRGVGASLELKTVK